VRNASTITGPELAAPIPTEVNLSKMCSEHSFWNKAARQFWGVTWLLFFRPSPRILHGWRRALLRLFGAKIGRGVRIHPSAQVWAPWQLEMGDFSCLGPRVDCYCVAPIRIEAHAVISQYSYLCSASHDHEHPAFPLVTRPIVIGQGAWVAADAFVGMGVTVGTGAVVGARASVFKDVEPWTVVGGNPARFIKKRVLTPS
jgi:putative colanic acid biosynthesis acetyltransferase WcaF